MGVSSDVAGGRHLSQQSARPFDPLDAGACNPEVKH
jgi:hypothetical protein